MGKDLLFAALSNIGNYTYTLSHGSLYPNLPYDGMVYDGMVCDMESFGGNTCTGVTNGNLD